MSIECTHNKRSDEQILEEIIFAFTPIKTNHPPPSDFEIESTISEYLMGRRIKPMSIEEINPYAIEKFKEKVHSMWKSQ